LAYQLFRSVQLHAGWTGIATDGIARSSNMINYTLPSMGINLEKNEQDLFIHGLNIGLTINR
jgi:hypothetical protein